MNNNKTFNEILHKMIDTIKDPLVHTENYDENTKRMLNKSNLAKVALNVKISPQLNNLAEYKANEALKIYDGMNMIN